MIGRERLDAGTVHELNRFSQERQQDSGIRKSTTEQCISSGRWA
jgi:hypothetical protein